MFSVTQVRLRPDVGHRIDLVFFQQLDEFLEIVIGMAYRIYFKVPFSQRIDSLFSNFSRLSILLVVNHLAHELFDFFGAVLVSDQGVRPGPDHHQVAHTHQRHRFFGAVAVYDIVARFVAF